MYMMPRETLNKTKSTRSNERTHGSDFVTLRFIQRVPLTWTSRILQTTPSAKDIGAAANPRLWFKGFRTGMSEELFGTIRAIGE